MVARFQSVVSEDKNTIIRKEGKKTLIISPPAWVAAVMQPVLITII
jgi:hypothetical protein